ncbi:MAG: hypothetical protein FIB07_12385 [Candidatus Methanoperedens sp.]|nr:hypothetical protein [Candidatus Methanoperedens sp.]
MKKTWYQIEGSKRAEIWTILHLPYTAMNLSFLAIGFGIAGIHRWDVFAWVIVAYFLGLGIAAHSFDQLPGMGSSYVKYLMPRELLLLGLAAVSIAVIISIYWMIELAAWHLLWMIPLQTFFVWAYPARFMKGFFHNDFWFAVSFGFIPVMVGFYLNTLTLNPAFLIWAVLAANISAIEITLSRYVRAVRKDVEDAEYYIHKPEIALKLLCLMSYFLAISFLAR